VVKSWKNNTALQSIQKKNQNILSLKTEAGISVSVGRRIQISWFCVLFYEQCKIKIEMIRAPINPK
jgi:hypothetical protein